MNDREAELAERFSGADWFELAEVAAALGDVDPWVTVNLDSSDYVACRCCDCERPEHLDRCPVRRALALQDPGYNAGGTSTTPTVAEMGGAFEGGPDSVEWLRDQRNDS